MYEIELSQLPAGYASHAIPDSHYGWILVKEFSSTEDGHEFVQRLEGLPDLIRRQLPEEVLPSQIDHLLAIIRRDRTASVYINELAIFAHARLGRTVDAGQEVAASDLVDIDRLNLGVELPDDAGVVFLFSVGWRKGLLYDLVPLGGPSPTPRDYDLPAYLGQIYGYVLFQERFSLSDAEWDAFLNEQWFPFIGLSEQTIRSMIAGVRSGTDIDGMLDGIMADVEPRLPEMLANWKKSPALATHTTLLERAVERFQAEDYISCSSILFPRIEGILRAHRKRLPDPSRPTQGNMVESAVNREVKESPNSLLFPKRFAKYLSDIYFADFDPDELSVKVGRHSVSHGVASPEAFDAKAAVIGLLMTHQLFFFLH